jgi:hypothetical protein
VEKMDIEEEPSCSAVENNPSVRGVMWSCRTNQIQIIHNAPISDTIHHIPC